MGADILENGLPAILAAIVTHLQGVISTVIGPQTADIALNAYTEWNKYHGNKGILSNVEDILKYVLLYTVLIHIKSSLPVLAARVPVVGTTITGYITDAYTSTQSMYKEVSLAEMPNTFGDHLLKTVDDEMLHDTLHLIQIEAVTVLADVVEEASPPFIADIARVIAVLFFDPMISALVEWAVKEAGLDHLPTPDKHCTPITIPDFHLNMRQLDQSERDSHPAACFVHLQTSNKLLTARLFKMGSGGTTPFMSKGGEQAIEVSLRTVCSHGCAVDRLQRGVVGIVHTWAVLCPNPSLPVHLTGDFTNFTIQPIPAPLPRGFSSQQNATNATTTTPPPMGCIQALHSGFRSAFGSNSEVFNVSTTMEVGYLHLAETHHDSAADSPHLVLNLHTDMFTISWDSISSEDNHNQIQTREFGDYGHGTAWAPTHGMVLGGNDKHNECATTTDLNRKRWDPQIQGNSTKVTACRQRIAGNIHLSDEDLGHPRAPSDVGNLILDGFFLTVDVWQVFANPSSSGPANTVAEYVSNIETTCAMAPGSDDGIARGSPNGFPETLSYSMCQKAIYTVTLLVDILQIDPHVQVKRGSADGWVDGYALCYANPHLCPSNLRTGGQPSTHSTLSSTSTEENVTSFFTHTPLPLRVRISWGGFEF